VTAAVVRKCVAVVVATLLMGSLSAAASPERVGLCGGVRLSGSSLIFPRETPAKPSSDGTVYPVLFVHGFNSSSQTWTRPATTTWTTYDRTDNASAVELVGGIDGALPVLFDYRDRALEWVDDPAIGPALADVIECLSRESGNKVIVIAHSMGGLATRFALGDPVVAAEVSMVITLGTPNLGSFGPHIVNGLDDFAATADRWNRTAERNGSPAVAAVSEAFSAQYRAWLSLRENCAQQIARRPVAQICGELTPLVAAMDSPAGRGLAAGSHELDMLPVWKDPKVYAMRSSYLGTGHDDVIGDGVVYPASTIAGTTTTRTAACQVEDRWYLGDLGSHWNGCWHSDQPANLDLLSFAFGQVRRDVDARRRPPPIDWQNTHYTVRCDGDFDAPLSADVRDGRATGRTSDGSRSWTITVDTVASGDLTGDGSPETVVLATCVPEPTNYSVEEILVLDERGGLLATLPDQRALVSPERFLTGTAVANDNLVIEADRLAPDQCRACGDPQLHLTYTWRWDGGAFVGGPS